LQQVMMSVDELARLTDANAQLVAESVLAADGMNDSAGHLRAMVSQVQAGQDMAVAVAVDDPALVEADGVQYF
jgi:hypothetical protein